MMNRANCRLTHEEIALIEIGAELQREIDKSRKLHDRLVECDTALSSLEENITAYKIADYHQRFMAIQRLRAQTREEIERHAQKCKSIIEALQK